MSPTRNQAKNTITNKDKILAEYHSFTASNFGDITDNVELNSVHLVVRRF
jgi:hypothetical protein